MKTLKPSLAKITLFLIPIVLGSFALCQTAHAVNPPPDGGYPGGNTAEGQNALFSLTTGSYNTAVGYLSLRTDNTGGFNTALGAGALFSNTGDQNTAIGAAAGLNLTSGHNNICIGSGVVGVAGESNTIRIGDNLPADSACYIGGLLREGGAYEVRYDANTGQLGTAVSSRRFKRDIKPMDKASEAIMALKPVTFHYKRDAKNTLCFGLIAEEVEKINPDLVLRDKDGKPYSVIYDHVNAMLLNEFLKEHKRVEEQNCRIQQQEATIAELKNEMHVFADRLKAQDSKIQKVSTRLELNKPAQKTIASD